METVRTVAVIMAGGRGERLWPRSRVAAPKQFIRLGGSERTLIQATVDRIRPLVRPEDVWIVTGAEWVDTVLQQLPEIPSRNVLVEPAGRNTAACIGLATVAVRRRFGVGAATPGGVPPSDCDPVMIVLPSDHVIRDDVAFRRALQAAVLAAAGPQTELQLQAKSLPARPRLQTWAELQPVAQIGEEAQAQDQVLAQAEAAASSEITQAMTPATSSGQPDGELPFLSGASSRLSSASSSSATSSMPLVTLGIWPTRPETGYGYVHFSQPLAHVDGSLIYEVRDFTEKPDAVTAQRFLADGHYLWNSGMFIWRTSRIWQAFGEHLPELREALERIERIWTQAFANQPGDGPLPPDLIVDEYAQIPSVSIDYGIMEKAHPIVTIPCGFGWDDVGSWTALERVFPVNDEGNVVQMQAGATDGDTGGGEFVAVDTHGCIVVQDDGGREEGGLEPEGHKGREAPQQRKGRLIAALGVEDLVIVDSDDVLLVASKERAQEIKELLAEIRRRGLERFL